MLSLELMMATLALAIGSFMNILDSTIVNVSLSHIAGDFAVAPTQGTWVITSYAVAEAIFLPLIGWLTKRFGIVRQYMAATLLFTLASILCGLSFSFEFLLFARVLQGVVGASMIPLSQTLMLGLYPKDKKGLALGIWSMTVILAPVFGPMIGGWITDSFSWRWCFYINIPFGLVSTFIVYSIFKKKGYKDKTEKAPIDIWGLVFLIIGIGALQIMLDKGNDLDWFGSPFIVILTIIAFIFIVLLVIWEWHQENPVVNIKLFLNRNFTIGSICLTLGSIAFFSVVVVIPLWLQNYMGYTALKSGLTTCTMGIASMVLAPVIGNMLTKHDARKFVIFGFFVFALMSFLTGHYTPDVTSGYVSFSRFVTGFAMPFFFIPLSAISLYSVEPEDLASASGLHNFMRNIGNSFGTSLATNFWNNKMAIHHEEIISAVQPGNPGFITYINQIPGTLHDKLASINDIITLQSAIMGVNDLIFVSGIIMLCLIPIALIAKKTN